MKASLFLLEFLLFSFVFSDNDEIKYNQDSFKCAAPNANPYAITTQTCTSITPSLEAEGIYKGKCCKLVKNPDLLRNFKMLYKENWKKMVCQMYGINENYSDEQINSIIGSNYKDTKCQIITNLSKLTTLYSESLLSIDGKVEYDCGEGEKTFYTNNFVPENEDEQLGKDIVDCNIEFAEKNCYKAGEKLSTSLAQCCWCETKYLTPEYAAANGEVCMGFRNDNFLQTLNNMLNTYTSSNMKIEYKCNCYDKNGYNSKGSFNSATGDLNVE